MTMIYLHHRAAIVFVAIVITKCQLIIPENPCPEVFQYKSDNGLYHGQVQVNYRGSTNFDLQVNVSIIGLFYSTPKLTIKLLTPIDENIKNRPQLQYRIDFPFQDVLPKITQIEFNGNVECHGPPEPLGVKGVTNLWATSTHRLFTYPTRINYNNINNAIGDNNPFLNTNTPLPPRSPATVVVPAATMTTTTTTTTTTIRNVIENDSTDSEVKCGLLNNIQSLVINGKPLKENEYPWMAAMFFRDGVSYKFHCTANLITKRHVITAGHCVQFHRAPLLKNEDMLFIFGRSELTHWASDGAVIRTASRVYVHPEYRQFSGNGDAAIVRLQEAVPFSSVIRPVCLWDFEDVGLERIVGQSGVVAGWGRNEKGVETSSVASKVKMPIVSQVDCLKSNPGFNNITSELTFCAGNRDGSGPCTGDSGAGLILERNGRWYLRGLVSQAIKEENSFACNLKEFLVFSDLAKIRTWIHNIIE